MKTIYLLIALFSLNSFALTHVNLNESILDTAQMEFLTHVGAPDSMANSLALNVEYEQVQELRSLIESEIGRELKFFTGWAQEGEAHVTTINPVEFRSVLRFHLSMERINQIARDEDIQSSDLQIMGIGSGEREINGSLEETFYLIVDSAKLRKIRYLIYQEFVSNGGDPKAFDPTWFFPHITIGFTERDIHENSGLLKNIKHSYDERFQVRIQ